MISGRKMIGKRTGAMLLVGTILSGWAAPLAAQETPPAAAPTAPAPSVTTATPAASGTIRSIAVRGAERLEPETVRSYANLNPGQSYTAETLDAALKDLYATELFADVVITGADTGNLVITVRENPVINRIVLEGNKRIKDEKITPEIKLAPRQIFTRSKARADVDRIIELYKREGRFAATVEPKIVQLDQNRVDLIFEIHEGDKSKVRAINIIGNDQFGDGELRKEMYTRQAGGLLGILKSNDSYDPDRLAADQQKLRAFYLTNGYADFRVVSALAELTPDRRDFIITYVIEEGDRYKFGAIEAESELRDFTPQAIKALVQLKPGGWFNAKAVEDTVAGLNEVAGTLGYAFADISPAYQRDAEKKEMAVTFRVGEVQRVYVERIDIQGNTVTRDKVIRREFRVNEGDAFNAIRVKRSQDRIQSLGFFQDKLEIKQTQGSAPDRVILSLDVEEKPTGQLQLSAGFSSLEQLILSASIAQTNFMGKGQQLSAGLNYSRYSKSAQLGFVEPYLFDRSILLGGDLYIRDYNSFNYDEDGNRDTTYEQRSAGGGIRLGFPITEFVNLATRYSLVQDKISLDEDTFFNDTDDDGDEECDPAVAGQYLCDEIGTRLTSAIGYSVLFDNTNGARATRGQRMVLSQDFAGLGGDVKFIRTRGEATKYWGFAGGFILSAHAEGGYIHPLQEKPSEFNDAIRLTDRFYGAQMRGFDIRGIGPRVQRFAYDTEGEVDRSEELLSDALGGRAYYMGRIELEIPLSDALRNYGLRPSAFVDVGSVWNLTQPKLQDIVAFCNPVSTNTTGESFQRLPGDPPCPNTNNPLTDYTSTPGIKEFFVGNSPKPRVSIGVGVNWVSPFGPLRLDLARALMKQDGDETKFFSFNVGTSF